MAQQYHGAAAQWAASRRAALGAELGASCGGHPPAVAGPRSGRGAARAAWRGRLLRSGGILAHGSRSSRQAPGGQPIAKLGGAVELTVVLHNQEVEPTASTSILWEPAFARAFVFADSEPSPWRVRLDRGAGGCWTRPACCPAVRALPLPLSTATGCVERAPEAGPPPRRAGLGDAPHRGGGRPAAGRWRTRWPPPGCGAPRAGESRGLSTGASWLPSPTPSPAGRRRAAAGLRLVAAWPRSSARSLPAGRWRPGTAGRGRRPRSPARTGTRA